MVYIYILLIITLYIFTERITVHFEYNEKVKLRISFFYQLIHIDLLPLHHKLTVKKHPKRVKEPNKDPMKNNEMNLKKKILKLLNQIQSLMDAYPIALDFLGKVNVVNYKVHTKVGVTDSALLGQITGFLWILNTMAMMFLNSLRSIKHIDVAITPIYNKNDFALDIDCIFSIKLVHIIIVILKHLKTIPLILKKAL